MWVNECVSGWEEMCIKRNEWVDKCVQLYEYAFGFMWVGKIVWMCKRDVSEII